MKSIPAKVKAPVPPTANPALLQQAKGRAELLKEAEGSEYRMRALVAFYRAADAPSPKGW